MCSVVWTWHKIEWKNIAWLCIELVRRLTNDIQKRRNEIQAKERNEPSDQPVKPNVDPVKSVFGVKHFRRFSEPPGMEEK